MIHRMLMKILSFGSHMKIIFLSVSTKHSDHGIIMHNAINCARTCEWRSKAAAEEPPAKSLRATVIYAPSVLPVRWALVEY